MVDLASVDFKDNYMQIKFKVENHNFCFDGQLTEKFLIQSSPYAYDVNFIESYDNFSWIQDIVESQSSALFFIDKNIHQKLFGTIDFKTHPVLLCEATEENKNIDSILSLCDFLQMNNANRGSMVYVIGGGIIQDIGAYACKTFKRGIPWTLIPTTLLSQCDSCIGGKTAVNHGKAKNILGLFAAPHQVLIDVKFIESLLHDDLLSGFGEILKLCITGGFRTFEVFQNMLLTALNGDKIALKQLILVSLYIKKQIIEKDEFEFNIRRSLNYGHSLGHAIEVLSDFSISHGMAITFGVLVENMISYQKGILSQSENSDIIKVAQNILTKKEIDIFKNLNFTDILRLLKNDKKSQGKNLKMAAIRSIGDTFTLEIPLDQRGVDLVTSAYNTVVEIL